VSDYTIRSMSLAECETIAIAWARLEGWNPSLNDAKSYYNIDPNGFLVGLLDGEPIAAISALRYGESFGFIGFYIVKPAFRGQGYGIQIWNRAMEYLEGRTIGLDGVVDQQDNYRKSGFALAYNNIRFEGKSKKEPYDESHIIPLQSFSLGSVAQFEKPFFPQERRAFLEQWITQPDAFALGFVEDSKLLGYGVMRRCDRGYKVAPLFGANYETAHTLLLALLAKLPADTTFYLDVPKPNSKALKLADALDMQESFYTARMYRGEEPKLPIEQIFSVTSFEVG